MKRIITIKPLFVFFVLLFANFSVSIEEENLNIGICEMTAQSNEVTCYSAYIPCQGEECWVIWRCGTCGSVTAKQFQDSGTCSPSLPGEG